MIDIVNGLRRIAEEGYRFAGDAADEIERLRASLEVAETDAAHQKALAESALRVAEGWERKCDSLRAKIAEMEQQGPVGKFVQHPSNGLWEQDGYGDNPDASPLYALPGAQAQNVPKAVAYLDLGTCGYMDIGTEFTDEDLATLPKGRHMLGIVGTYGVDGYVPAQPAPSMPDVDSLAQFIREVDGSHQLGAGVLAERIAEWLKAAKEAKP